MPARKRHTGHSCADGTTMPRVSTTVASRPMRTIRVWGNAVFTRQRAQSSGCTVQAMAPSQ